MKQLTHKLSLLPFFILLLFCFPHLGKAQEQINHSYGIDLAKAFDSNDLTIEHYLKDSRGVFWFATRQKIVSYDGTTLRRFDEEKVLDNNLSILNLLEDNLGNIWLLTGSYDKSIKRAAYVFDYSIGSFIPFEDYLIEPYVGTLNKLQIGGLINEVNVLIKFEDINSCQVSELKDKKIVDLFKIDLSDKPLAWPMFGWKYSKDSYSFLMVPTANVDKKEWKYSIINVDLDGNRLGEYKFGTPWPELLSQYFVEIDYAKFIAVNTDIKIFSENISAFLSNHLRHKKRYFEFTEKYALLCDDSFENMYRYDIHSFDIIDTIKNPTPQLKLIKRFLDRNDGLWFIDENSFTRANFKTSLFKNIFSANSKLSIRKNRGIAQRGKDIFYSEHVTLNRYTEGNTEPYKQIISTVNDKLNFLLTGLLVKDDKLFAATEAHGLLEVSLGTKDFKRYDFFNEESSFLWQPYMDNVGQIWVGSKGLVKLDKENGNLVKADDGDFNKLANVVTYHFYDTSEGTWLCTSNGLYLVNLQTQKILAHYNDKMNDEFFLPLKNCVHLYEDENGVFWIATKGQGVVKWNRPRKEYISYTTENIGLSHDIVYAIYPDDFGNLWIPSNKGLMKFNIKSETISTFLVEHGLPNNEFNTISHFKDTNGHLYFGTIAGLISFDPKDIESQVEREEQFFISSAITTNRKTKSEINVLGKLLDKNIVDVYSIDEITDIQLSLPSFDNINDVVYNYKFAGKSNSWKFSRDGKVRLGDLDYGDYELLLRAKPMASKKWTEYTQPIRVVVHTPVHKKWWFRIMLALLAGALVFCFVKIYTRQLVKKQQELEQVVADRTEEIRYQAEGLKVQSEELRVQAEELKSLDKVKNNFFTNISHELKTPITLILGPLSYILDSSNGLKEADVKKQLIVLERNAKNLEKLVQEILDLSKLEANKIELEEVATNVDDFITYVVSAFDSQLMNLGIKCEIHNLVEKSTNVLLDRDKVEKILNNFISNAIKYTQDEGLVAVEVTEKNEILTISVRDNGKGIHEKDLPHVFDRFFQTKFGENKMLGGTGIGLALVKELSELMNGEVKAISELGRGSTFTFSLPMTKVNNLAPEVLHTTLEYIDENNEDIDVSQFSILIVEDNEDMREFIKELLSNLYENLFTANNGAEALQILEQKNNKIDLIVSDVMMPKVNGLELFKRVREAKDSSTIPFIVLTALSSERDKLTSLLVGVDDYLTKPFSVPELLARVNNLLVNYAYRKQWWSGQNQAALTISNKEDFENRTGGIQGCEADRQFVVDLKNHIEANLIKKELNVDSLAKAFFISSRTLHRKLKSITGLTPNKLIKEVQLQKARSILETNRNISISEVAYQVGFAQRSTFAIHFKKRFGVVPSKFNWEPDTD